VKHGVLTVTERLREVNTARWLLRGRQGCELHITGEGRDLNDNYHAALCQNGELLYEGDGESKDDAWHRLILAIPREELAILRAFLPAERRK
jgi:hypothetical protein